SRRSLVGFDVVEDVEHLIVATVKGCGAVIVGIATADEKESKRRCFDSEELPAAAAAKRVPQGRAGRTGQVAGSLHISIKLLLSPTIEVWLFAISLLAYLTLFLPELLSQCIGILEHLALLLNLQVDSLEQFFLLSLECLLLLPDIPQLLDQLLQATSPFRYGGIGHKPTLRMLRVGRSEWWSRFSLSGWGKSGLERGRLGPTGWGTRHGGLRSPVHGEETEASDCHQYAGDKLCLHRSFLLNGRGSERHRAPGIVACGRTALRLLFIGIPFSRLYSLAA